MIITEVLSKIAVLSAVNNVILKEIRIDRDSFHSLKLEFLRMTLYSHVFTSVKTIKQFESLKELQYMGPFGPIKVSEYE